MNKREYREMVLELPQEAESTECRVEGYASTFEPYVLLTVDGIDYKEQIDPTAFDEADMTDVVFRIDHEGRVYARTRAGSVELSTDDHGLRVSADLSRTASAREVYEDIKAGNYDRMSFAFSVADGGDEYDKETHTRSIHRVAKVFDISPVSFPANPGTAISARDYFDGVIEAEKAERLEAEQRAKELEEARTRLRLKLKLKEVSDEH